ncbi:MAG: zinc-binding alcohol dehydrogenase family protein [Lautropia sp.]
MRAAVLHEPGPPEAFSIEELPVPRPANDEVLVEVAACGVSYRDIVERNGTYRRDVRYPLIIGLEIAGTVRELGTAVRRLKVGDRVCSKAFSSCGACRLCRTGRETTCASRQPVRGGYGEYVALPEDAFCVLPESVSFEIACSLGPAAGVALNAVRDVARVTIGDTVLVTGASGGVGHAAMQLAKRSGARVIAATRDESKRLALLDAGADEVVPLGTRTGFSRRVLDLTDGAGVDVVIDNVGSRVFDACFDALARHGRYAMVGQLFGEDVSINPARIFFKRAQLLGVGSVSRAQLDDAIRLAAAGQLTIMIAARVPLAEVAQAHRWVEEGGVIGRVVLTMRE